MINYDVLNNFVVEVKDVKYYQNKSILFNESDGLVKLSEYSKYLILSQAEKFFAKKICEMDHDQKFHRRKIELGFDQNAINDFNAKNKGVTKRYYDEIHNWRELHKNYFQSVNFISSIQNYAKDFEFNKYKNFTLENLIQGYKFCKEQLALISRDDIAICKKFEVKNEFKDIYNEFCKSLKSEIGYVTESEFKKTLEKNVEKESTRLCLNRKPSENPGSTNMFSKMYILYLMEHNFKPSNN